MARLRDGLLPLLIVSMLLFQYAAVGHVLAHLGVGPHGVWAGAPLGGDEPNSDPQPGGCEAPQLHALIGGVPLALPPQLPQFEAGEAAQEAFLFAVADRAAPEPVGRGPPHSL